MLRAYPQRGLRHGRIEHQASNYFGGDIFPIVNKVTVYSFQPNEMLTKIYNATDTAPVGIFPDFGIALDQVFAELR